MASSGVRRDLQFLGQGHAPQSGPDIEKLQRAINKRAKARGITLLKVDGEAGRQTIATGRRVAVALGLELHQAGLTKSTQRVIRNPLRRTPAQLARARKWQEAAAAKPAAVRISGNTVTGGTVRDRIYAAAMEAARLYYNHVSHRFYSQPGRWTVDHAITGEPSGCRSDCSQFVTGIYHSAGAKDPNENSYNGGFTGTLARGKRISRSELKPGDLVLYGVNPYHHVEMYVGPGDRTVGHGSPPVDYGDIDMIAQPNFYTYDI